MVYGGSPVKSLNHINELDSNDQQYIMQIKTRRYAIIVIVFGLIMLLTGYSALSYDIV